MLKEHRNVLAGSTSQFWIKLANVEESFTQREECNFRSGTKISANHVAPLCWEEPIIDRTNHAKRMVQIILKDWLTDAEKEEIQ